MRPDEMGTGAWRKRRGDSEIGTYRERWAWARLNPSRVRPDEGYEYGGIGWLVVLAICGPVGLFMAPYVLAEAALNDPSTLVAVIGGVVLLGLAAALARPLRTLGLRVVGFVLAAAMMALFGIATSSVVGAIGYGAVPLSVLLAVIAGSLAWRAYRFLARRWPVAWGATR
jgi:hypothetical protein